MRRQLRSMRRMRPVARNCNFCSADTSPDYKDTGVLTKYITERGKILSHQKTGVCSKHQRQLTRAVKYARHVALLPFVIRA